VIFVTSLCGLATVLQADRERVELLRALYQAHDQEGKKTVLGVCAEAVFSPNHSVHDGERSFAGLMMRGAGEFD
jgi:hypothetical protein